MANEAEDPAFSFSVDLDSEEIKILRDKSWLCLLLGTNDQNLELKWLNSEGIFLSNAVD